MCGHEPATQFDAERLHLDFVANSFHWLILTSTTGRLQKAMLIYFAPVRAGKCTLQSLSWLTVVPRPSSIHQGVAYFSLHVREFVCLATQFHLVFSSRLASLLQDSHGVEVSCKTLSRGITVGGCLQPHGTLLPCHVAKLGSSELTSTAITR